MHLRLWHNERGEHNAKRTQHPPISQSDEERIEQENRRYKREKDRIFYEREVASRDHYQNLKRFDRNVRMTWIENQRHDRVEARLDADERANEERHKQFYENVPDMTPL